MKASERVRVDSMARFWSKMVHKDTVVVARKMQRLQQEEDAPEERPLYMSPEEISKHRLVNHYVERLQAREEEARRNQAIEDTRSLLRTVLL